MKKFIYTLALVMLIIGIMPVIAEFQIITWGQSNNPAGFQSGTNWILGGNAISCNPIWNCTSYTNCSYLDIKNCLALIELSSCGSSFTGALSSYNATCAFDIEEFCDENPKTKICKEITMWDLGLILIPLILGLFCLIGAATLDKIHAAFKIFLFLLSLASVILSFYIGTVVINGTDAEITAAVSKMTNVVVWILYATIGYFAIYLIYTIIKKMNRDKEEGLKY